MNIYAPPKANLITEDDVGTIYNDGRYIVIDDAPIFPKRCHRCNTPTDSTLKTQLVRYPPYLFLLPLLYFCTPLLKQLISASYLPYFIAAIILLIIALTVFTRQVLRFELPTCHFHLQRRKYILMATGLCVMVMFISLLLALHDHAWSPIVLILWLICFFVLLVLDVYRPYVGIIKVKHAHFWLRGAGKDFRDSLPPY